MAILAKETTANVGDKIFSPENSNFADKIYCWQLCVIRCLRPCIFLSVFSLDVQGGVTHYVVQHHGVMFSIQISLLLSRYRARSHRTLHPL